MRPAHRLSERTLLRPDLGVLGLLSMSNEQVTPPDPPQAQGGTWESDPLIGTLLNGRYRIKTVIGRGGMGVVYDAVQEDLDRKVAIKVVSSEHANDSKVIDRFLRE